jgi:sugar phosphate isomerase/epimerase
MVVGGPWARLDEPSAGFLPRVLAALRPPVALAAQRGVALALENHADLTLDEMEQVLDELDAPHLGVCFDTSNWVRVGDDPVDAARRLAGRVRVVHLKDHVARPDDGLVGPRSTALGSGQVDLAGVLEPLLAAEPDLPVCVELGHLGPGVDEVELVERGVAWLRAEATRRAAVAKGG